MPFESESIDPSISHLYVRSEDSVSVALMLKVIDYPGFTIWVPDIGEATGAVVSEIFTEMFDSDVNPDKS